MSLLSQPLISYAELNLTPPCHQDLWNASNALQWKTAYLTHIRSEDATSHARRCMLDDVSYILGHQQILDVDVSLLLAIASTWPHLWQYREMLTSSKDTEGSGLRHGSLIVSSRRQEVLQMLERIRLHIKEWCDELQPVAWLLHEQCSMHLCASLEDVQILAGKEGEEEARRIFPMMSVWAESADARQALFHAGQILRAARQYQEPMLRDASAVAVYHASLIFWAYAVASKADAQNLATNVSADTADSQKPDYVRLDGVDGDEVRRFLVLGRGIPCIQGSMQAGSSVVFHEVPLSEPADVMKAITRILQEQCSGGDKSVHPLLENLSKLMQSLGRAYHARRPR